MAYINTSRGKLEYCKSFQVFDANPVKTETLVDTLRLFAHYPDKIGMNWGPAFTSLIRILRGQEAQDSNSVFEVYLTKEWEESFKDILWLLADVGFRLLRYERRGIYYLGCQGVVIKIYVLSSIGCEVRQAGGTDFIPEKFIHDTIKKDWHGIALKVPADSDVFLSFADAAGWESGRLSRPATTAKWWCSAVLRLQDILPHHLCAAWQILHRQAELRRFQARCARSGINAPRDLAAMMVKRRKHKRVLTVGVYDLLHKGHVELYRRAQALGDCLIVAVQDGDFILKYKPTAKIMNSTEDRIHLIKAIRYVDEVVVYTDVDKIVRTVDFDIFVTGPDQCHEGFQRAIRWSKEQGKEHLILTRTEGVSSSELKAKLS